MSILPHLLFAATVMACAATFALLEIQIEGHRGWASGLPTWRVENRLTRLLLGGRPLTGYHAFCHVLILLLIHLPYALSLSSPSWQVEARLISFLILFWIVEDFLWFVFNPAYGLRGFNRNAAWWHRQSWWWVMPREYWMFLPIGIGLYMASLP